MSIEECINKYYILLEKESYEYEDLESAIKYGKAIMRENNALYTKVLTKLYKSFPYNRKLLLSIFVNEIYNNRFNNSFKVWELLYRSENNKEYIKDYLIYLELLTNLVKIPDNYLFDLTFLTFKDVRILEEDSNRFSDPPTMNNIRHKIITHRLDNANEIINYMSKTKEADYITNLLLSKVIEERRKLANNIIELILNDDYDEAKSIIQQNKYKNFANIELLEYLIEVLIKLKSGEQIIETEKEYSGNVLNNFIYRNNFSGALAFINSFDYRDDILNAVDIMLRTIIKYTDTETKSINKK